MRRWATSIGHNRMPLCVLLAGLSLTLLSSWISQLHEQQALRQKFASLAHTRQQVLERRIDSYLDLFNGLQGLFAAEGRVTAAEFDRYLDRQRLKERFPGIHHVIWQPLVNRDELRRHEAGLHRQGYPDYRVRAARPADAYFPMDYIYPMDEYDLRHVMGRDKTGSPERAQAIRRALADGAPRATGPLNLERHLGTAFVIYDPVYRRQASGGRRAPQGYIAMVFLARQLLAAAFGDNFADDFDVAIYSGRPGEPRPRLLFTSIVAPASGQIDYRGRLDIDGIAWELRFQPTERYLRDNRTGLPAILLLGGALASLLLAVLAREWDVRRRIAQQSEELNQQFRSLFDHNPDAVFSLDLDFKVTRVNAAVRALTGLDDAQILGRSVLSVVPQELAEQSRLRLEGARQGTPQWGETIVVRHDGRRVPIEIVELPIVVRGQIKGIFGIVKDISRRREYEAALREARQALEGRVRARTDELDRANRELQKVNRALKDLSRHLHFAREEERKRIAREIHDELGGNLTGIKMYVSGFGAALSGAPGFDPARLAAALRLVDDTIACVRRIINDLRPSVLDNMGLWAALEWLAHEFTQRTGIQCVWRLHGPEGGLDRDVETAIFRMVQEALTNVARHAGATEVQVHASNDDEEVILHVEDNGCGIPADPQRRDKSYGLRGMAERARHFGGQLHVGGAGGAGTLVEIIVPKTRRAASDAEGLQPDQAVEVHPVDAGGG